MRRAMIAVLMLSLGTARVVFADPVRIIAGDIFASGIGPHWFGEELAVTAADGFQIQDSLEDVNGFLQLGTSTFGPVGDFSGVFRVEDSIGATLDNAGVFIAAPFDFVFSASPVPLTCDESIVQTRCSGSAAFTVTADLTLNTFDQRVLHEHLVGTGTASGTLSRSALGDGGQVRYVFESTLAPTPEPSTLSLLGMTGLMVIARQWKKFTNRT